MIESKFECWSGRCSNATLEVGVLRSTGTVRMLNLKRHVLWCFGARSTTGTLTRYTRVPMSDLHVMSTKCHGHLKRSQ